MDSCRAISSAYNRRHHDVSISSPGSIIVKRENEVVPEYEVKFLENKGELTFLTRKKKWKFFLNDPIRWSSS